MPGVQEALEFAQSPGVFAVRYDGGHVSRFPRAMATLVCFILPSRYKMRKLPLMPFRVFWQQVWEWGRLETTA